MNSYASIESVSAEAYFPKQHPRIFLRSKNLMQRVGEEVLDALGRGYRLNGNDVREWLLCLAQEVVDNQDEHEAETIEIAHAWLDQESTWKRNYHTRELLSLVDEDLTCTHELRRLGDWCTHCGAHRTQDGSGWMKPTILVDMAYHAARLDQVKR
jgi:hypothetical protein